MHYCAVWRRIKATYRFAHQDLRTCNAQLSDSADCHVSSPLATPNLCHTKLPSNIQLLLLLACWPPGEANMFCILCHTKIEKTYVLTGAVLLRSQCPSSPPSSASVHCGDGAGAGGEGEQHPNHVEEEAVQQIPHEQLAKDGFNAVWDAGH